MTHTPKKSEHSDTSNIIVRPISLLWPFIVGSLFLLLVLGIVAFGDDPSPMQYTIYRIIIALGGAGFAVALTGHLQIQFPIFKSGYIKAAAAFAVFVILFFFTPAALTTESAKLETKRLLDEYNFANKDLVDAKTSLSSIWALERNGRKLSELAGQRTQASLEAARELINASFEDETRQGSFASLTSFHNRLFDCLETGRCDQGVACSAFFPEVESFRNLYCDRLIETSQAFSNGLWTKYQHFSETTCKRDFLALYVNYDEPEDLKNVCIPVQCWARHTKPPLPCDANQQVIAGTFSPT